MKTSVRSRKEVDGTIQKLTRFQKMNGSTLVPESHKDNKLGYWVGHQRQEYIDADKKRIPYTLNIFVAVK